MGDPSTPLPSFGRHQDSGETGPPLIPVAIGVVAVLLVIGAFILFGRGGANQKTPNTGVDPYASSLSISNPAMSTADNFAGQQVTYIEGKITNNGGKTVNNAVVQIVFHDSLGQVVQKETQPLMIITTREPYIDTAPLGTAPLHPGQTREFRLTFEHVSADWNLQLPDIAIMKTSAA
jgi:hypothetical protein